MQGKKSQDHSKILPEYISGFLGKNTNAMARHQKKQFKYRLIMTKKMMTVLIFGYQIIMNNFEFFLGQCHTGNIMFTFGCVTSLHYPIMDLIEWGFRVDQISARSI